MYDWAQRLEQKLLELPQLQDVNTDLQLDAPVVQVNVDRDRATALGRLGRQGSAGAVLGLRSAADLDHLWPGECLPVILEALPEDQRDETGLAKLYLRSVTGKLVPLSAVARHRAAHRPAERRHQGQLPAVAIGVQHAAGRGPRRRGERHPAVEREIGMPPTIVTGFTGAAQVFQQALAGQGVLVLAAVLIMYVVLGVLYEA